MRRATGAYRVLGWVVHVHADADYAGPDSFTWKANDGFDDSNVATFSITVVPTRHPSVQENGSTRVNTALPISLLPPTPTTTR